MNSGFMFPPVGKESRLPDSLHTVDTDNNFKFPSESVNQPVFEEQQNRPPQQLNQLDVQHKGDDYPQQTLNVIDIPPADLGSANLEISNTFLPQVENHPDDLPNVNINDFAGSTPSAFQQPRPDPASANSASSFPDEFIAGLRQKSATDWKSPSEYALHILFTKFVRFAETKLNICLQYPRETEPPIIEILGEGRDVEFDKIIESLGFISKKNAKPVIDAMMFWRKTKSEVAALAGESLDRIIQEYEQYLKNNEQILTASRTHSKSLSSASSRLSHRRNNSSKSSTSANSHTDPKLASLENQVERAKEVAFQADRKSLITIYILCRVLIEIVKQNPVDFDDELSTKLEGIVFTQLKTTDPSSLSSTLIKSANWNSFAELLGWMSEKKFVSVSDRFIADLEKIPPKVSRDQEPYVHLLILGMRYLKLKNFPLEMFEESAGFIKSISKFFAPSQNTSIRLAYAEVLSQLLLPLAGTMTAEANHPTWIDAMASILTTCKKLLTDSKCWTLAFKLTVAVLCVSDTDLFSKNWLPLIEKNVTKIKSKSLEDRIAFSMGLSRLIWVYLFRCTETLNNTDKTLTKLFSMFLSSKKKENWITTDMNIINPLCDVFVTVGFVHPTFVFENVLLTLIKSSFNGINLENIVHEKLILAINTYRGLLMTKERPTFPDGECRFYEVDLNKISVHQTDRNWANHEELVKYLYKLFMLLDSNIGSEVWSPENEHRRQPSTPFSNITNFGFGINNENNANYARSLNMALFATLIEVLPCCLSVSQSIPFKSTIEILSRNAVHADQLIATSAQNALKVLAAKRNPYTLITWFAKYSFDFDEKTQSRYSLYYLSSAEYRTLLELYVELLECWLDDFTENDVKQSDSETALNGVKLPQNGLDVNYHESEKLEWKNTQTVVEDVEGNGLFFLCSADASIRRLAIRILQLTSKFDKAMMQKAATYDKGHSRSSSRFVAQSGSRLIDMLASYDIPKLLEPDKQLLSVAEKSRLVKLTSKSKSNFLIRLCESEYGVDAALWQRVFPKLLTCIFEQSPVTMALCRSIVCIRLVQLYELILSIISNSTGKFKDILPEAVANQWRLYLIVACSSLTSTNNQRLHIPAANGQHGRKKSQQIFTVQHQKIKSATSVFKMVLPLLNSDKSYIKAAVIKGLSAMNINIYRAYIESIDQFLTSWNIDSSNNAMRMEMVHILVILSPFLKDPLISSDEWVLKKLSHYLKEMKCFLEIDEVQKSFEFQPLRHYFSGFLSTFYSSIRSNVDCDAFFPFEARASCFNFLKEWCGYGQYISVSSQRYRYMAANSQKAYEDATFATALEFQRGKLEIVSLECMIVLCSGEVSKTIHDSNGLPIQMSFDIAGLLCWIDSLLHAPNDKIKILGVRALKTILEANASNVELMREVLHQIKIQTSDTLIHHAYYSLFCEAICKQDTLLLTEDELVAYGLNGVVSNDKAMREHAIDLLIFIESKIYQSSYARIFKERLSNLSKTVYKSTAQEISNIFAELLSQEVRLKVFARMSEYFHLLPTELKQNVLVMFVPWVNKFALKSSDDIDTFMIVNNTFALTIYSKNRFPMEVEQLWISLGKGNSFQNIHVVLEYIISTSINCRNPEFVRHAREIVLFMANVPGGMGVVDTLFHNLEPKHMIPTSKILHEEPENNNKYSFIADIWSILDYHGKDVVFSKAQLSMIFLVNLLIIPNESVKARLPLLLHVSVCLLDHHVPIIQDSASRILCGIIYGLEPGNENSEETVNFIKNRQMLWAYENLTKESGARSPKSMDIMIRNIIGIFSEIDKLQVDWQRISLKWATTCSVRHIACRSFQIFRSLLTFLDQEMLRDMLHRLSNTISDENPDIQGFAMQILMTLNAITAELNAANLIDFPQLFWSVVACLNTIHEQEFIEVLSSLSKFVSKIDLDSPDTVQCLISTFPSNWEGKFDGLQQIVMIGLRSSNSWEISLQFLDRLNMLNDSQIIANKESRILYALLANLPRFLYALDTNDMNEEVVGGANCLISLCMASDEPSLSRIIDSMMKNKFRSKKDFMSQIVTFISSNFFPQYAPQALVFLLGLLFNDMDWVKIQTMQLLKHIFPLTDLSRPEFIGVGADFISPLLRLLLGELESDALEVLNTIPKVSGSKMDKDVLRISMGNKDAKKVYNKTATLFGIPEESGWSIPMPALTAASTRHNVHAVFTTCAAMIGGEVDNSGAGILEEIVEFHADGGYVQGTDEYGDLTSVTEDKDPSLSHMWAELDNLGSFFNKSDFMEEEQEDEEEEDGV
ncbi:unnamed protein product [Kluyveromyces dobzhanskii CBS 2104]|uniref:WGS project CCBQ000000000 data, contig 00015 n=1 Tax=Kluyveromyces dobzhanskii CBS 2104 TaxID=1427455 RepID=A0A0A8LBC6_9SACH|nr:unnamed protein product [Kluyveromyces dobzhanskii CBS 2104]